jgi:hypothetical protein
MAALSNLVARYRAALREEPKLRAYLAASLVDDIGVAVSAWASALLMTNLFTDQRERAKLMLPSLACFLLGCVVSGPLADWAGPSLARLARWRYRLVVWARVVETVALGVMVLLISRSKPTIGTILPYVMISAFMKTALRPTRLAFEVDLLRREAAQTAADGSPLLDERGAPRVYKVHLLPFNALTGALKTIAVLVGLLLGGRIMALAGGAYAPLYAVDVITNLGFVAVLIFACHPSKDARAVRPADLIRDPDAALAAPRRRALAAIRHFGASLREGARFLAGRDQRPLLALLAGSWIVEVVMETYDGKMIIKHVLRGADDAVRHAELGWSIVSAVGLVLLPALAGRVRSLGKIFLVVMLLDGLVIALAGRLAGLGAAAAILPFGAVLAVDKSLTLASGSLADLATNSASSPAMRGRIAALYAFVVLVGDVAAQIVATGLSEAIGIPAMLVRVGFAQVGLVALIGILGGRRLWSFGLHTAEDSADSTAPAWAAAPEASRAG